jgi:hypothetical protein
VPPETAAVPKPAGVVVGLALVALGEVAEVDDAEELVGVALLGAVVVGVPDVALPDVALPDGEGAGDDVLQAARASAQTASVTVLRAGDAAYELIPTTPSSPCPRLDARSGAPPPLGG